MIHEDQQGAAFYHLRYHRTTQPETERTVDDLLLAAPHHVDVLNANEVQLDVGVMVLVLIAFTCGSVRHGVQLRTQ